MTALSLPFPPLPTTTVEEVTPDVAAEWLATNGVNRALSPQTVAKYARDMRAGRWALTGESVKFCTTGRLRDGQHRLAAVVAADVPVALFITRGLAPEAQLVMDSGRSRSAADALVLRGVRNATLASSTAKLALALESGVAAPSRFVVSHSAIVAFWDEHPDLQDAVDFAKGIYRRTDCLPSVVAYTFWRFRQIDADAARRFWADAAEQVGLPAGDPVLAMTRRFAEARRGNERLVPEVLVAGVTRAWNHRRRNKPLKRLQLTTRSGDVSIADPL